MGFRNLSGSLQEKFSLLGENLREFFAFNFEKLQNFKNLSLGEQIAYGLVGAGLLLILISLVLFVV